MQTKLIAFAKTPGLSPTKTRLAKTLGTPFAERLYPLSIACVAEVLRETEDKLPNTKACWMIAEAGPISHFWSGPKYQLPEVLVQSAGDLGEKLSNAFQASFSPGNILGFLGTDLPQLSVRVIREGQKKIEAGADFVIGPARDGGFYLLLAKKPIPAHVWNAVPYSSSATCEELTKHLSGLGQISFLEVMTDIDEEKDLVFAEQELERLKQDDSILPSQARFLEFLKKGIE